MNSKEAALIYAFGIIYVIAVFIYMKG